MAAPTAQARKTRCRSASGTERCCYCCAAAVIASWRPQGCEPDVVTYTALINAYEKGGQWRRALQVRREKAPGLLARSRK